MEHIEQLEALKVFKINGRKTRGYIIQIVVNKWRLVLGKKFYSCIIQEWTACHGTSLKKRKKCDNF